MSAAVTTLMVRRVPRKFSQDVLLAQLDELAGPFDFDFFFLPWEVRRNSNPGFAFINFRTVEAAEKFSSMTHGRAWSSHADKYIEVRAACIQGLVPNLVNLVNGGKVEECSEHTPLILHCGRRLDFRAALDIFVPKVVLEHYQEQGPTSKLDPPAISKAKAACGSRKPQGPPASAVPTTTLVELGGGMGGAASPRVMRTIPWVSAFAGGSFRPPPGLSMPLSVCEWRI